MELVSEVYIITGGSSGIGLSLGEKLIEQGAVVYSFDIKHPKFVHPNFKFMQIDVTDEQLVEKALEEVRSEAGILAGLINCAGITGSGQSLKTTSPKEFRRVIETHLFGTYNVCHYGVKYLKQGGAIINISSLFAIRSMPNFIAYNSAKRAIISLTETMALELAPDIRVNAVAPGFIDTPMTQSNPNYEIMVKNTLEHYPLQRVGKPEDIAEVMMMLLTNPFITGETISVSGGAHL